ncbi:MAG: DUF4097 family beta strand repeat-containing protein [Bryobacterales bacterium]|nr:DUF4097 family beta strand repeat-containing protein [Bryobacterales bacterium]
MRVGVPLVLVPVLLAGTCACNLGEVVVASARFQEEFSHSFPMRPGARLALESYNGAVEILGWEKDEIRISGVKYAGSEADLKDLKVEIERSEQSVRVRVVPPGNRRGASGVRFVLRVPRRVELDPILTSNGSLRLEDLQGPARLETSNGSITLRQLEGRIEARTSNGAISGSDLAGEVRLRTSNGSIRLERLKGTLEAATSNSPIVARILEPAAGGPLRVVTSNGSVELTLEAFQANPLTVATSNGSITLRLPATIGARIEAVTSNGSVHTDFELSGRFAAKGRLEGEIGGGGPPIRLGTSNGSIRVLRS